MFCRVGIQLPTVEVRYRHLSVEAECEVVHGKPLSTLWTATKSMLSVSICVFMIIFRLDLLMFLSLLELSFCCRDSSVS